MKPHLLKIADQAGFSFSTVQGDVPLFANRWHFHPEVEMICIEQGTGTHLVGDSIGPFGAGDVLLIGANLPHYWRCDDPAAARPGVRAVAAHFREDFWGPSFLALPENQPITRVLARARQGLRLRGRLEAQVRDGLNGLLRAQGSERICLLLQCLHAVAGSSEYQVLSVAAPGGPPGAADTDRLRRIYAYSAEHFRRQIPLREVAAVANISPHAFCRYFRAQTRKTYSHFLLELRVSYACKLLLAGELTVSQVCYESGFNHFSGFNKHFKRLTGRSPSQYRRSVQ
ncbi:MAG TPA: AraC family transcriptional regulator [Cytophagales bacterium]|jgi:AraC-like DNA-binding protein